MKMMIAFAMATAALPAAAVAQAPGAAATPALDPARVEAARLLIDLLMPPDRREQMIEGMMKPMLANLRRGMSESPSFAQAMKDDPRAKAMFDQFMVRQEQRIDEMMRQALPGMVPAMANAYARRFDLQQLHDLQAFFATPTGRAYRDASFTIMSDPDIAAWQRQMMTQSMVRVQEDVADFARRIAAEKANGTKTP